MLIDMIVFWGMQAALGKPESENIVAACSCLLSILKAAALACQRRVPGLVEA
ncbi:hypothetical protein ACO0LO_24005 [Undibacterium sp. TJN25]|uniref:hypothetical protein n=1 Tax=Undibacterium sp. TJN25 TaxID=3413056 RepID=UPI003BF33DE4